MPSWKYRAYRFAWGGLDLLFPPACGGCGKPGWRWCESCQASAVPIADPLCSICGKPLPHAGLCPDCCALPPPFTALRSWLIFEGPIRKAIHRLKYQRDLGLGDALAVHLADYASRLDWQAEIILPVPLGEKRLRERGYNQVGSVAWPLAMLMGWQYLPRALRRVRETASQVGLSEQARRQNVQGAFWADPEQVRDRTVILMDDVATTGSTLSASAQALLQAGASRVYALTIARALPRHGLQVV